MELQIKNEFKLLEELKTICGEHKYAIKCADGEFGWDDEDLSHNDLYRLAANHGGKLYIYSRAHNQMKVIIRGE